MQRLELFLAVVLMTALLPQPAPAATGSLFLQQVCSDISTIPGLYGFETDFVGVKDCQKLCKQAVTVCERAVKDAASCQLAFSSDWVASDTAVTCAGLTGADLSDCKASWSDDKKAWQAGIKQQRQFGIVGCLQHLNICQLRCTGQ